MASRIKKGEWLILYLVAGVIDVIQILMDAGLTEFLGAPEIINEVADPILGVILLGYLKIRKVKLTLKRIVSVLGVTGLEELTFGIAPAWIVDIWYIHRDVRIEEQALEAEENKFIPAPRPGSRPPPVYDNGVRKATPLPARKRMEDINRPDNDTEVEYSEA